MTDLSRFFDELALATVFNIQTDHRAKTVTAKPHTQTKAETQNRRNAVKLLPYLPATRAMLIKATGMDAATVSRALVRLRKDGKAACRGHVWRRK